MSQGATSQTASDVDEILARGVQLAVARKLPELTEMLPGFEKMYPATEQQWQSLLSIYSAAHKVAWTEIATRRFLEKEPNNIRARLKEVDILYNTYDRKKESFEKLELLEGVEIEHRDDLLLAARICIQCNKMQIAKGYLRKIISKDANDYDARLQFMAYFSMHGHFAEAKAELHALTSVEEYKLGALSVIIRYSLHFKEPRYAKHILSVAVRRINDGNNHEKTQILDNAIKMRESSSISKILSSIDIPSMQSERELAALYDVIEGRGHRREENLIFERAKALNVKNGRLGEVLRQLSQSGDTFFFLDDKMAAPSPGGVFGRAFHAVRTRLSGPSR